MKIWVILSAESLTDRIRSLLDKGEFSLASKLHYDVDGFCEMLKVHLQKEAGSIFSFVPDRIVVNCSVEMGEQIPLMVDGFKEQVKSAIACGVGMSFEEASKALIKSRNTKQIELYDPEVMSKADEFELELPINDTDPKVHEYKEKIKPKKEKEFVVGPSVEDELKMQTQYLAQLVQALSGQPPQAQQAQQQVPPQQEQQAPQGQQEQGAGPQKSLYEHLLGAPAPEGQPEEEQAPEVEQKAESTELDPDAMTPEEKSHLDQIGEGLINIKEQIPQLMDLADRNPQAFKQAMSLIQKMLSLAGKKVKKSELETEEGLTKAIESAIDHDKVYPVGTVKNRRKKIALPNRASWRGVASGMLKDTQGNAISVKSNNAKADADDDLPIK